MTYEFARICLARTDYPESVSWRYIRDFDPDTVHQLLNIYRVYCVHKGFSSVMPLFESRFSQPNTDVIGYYDQHALVAFSIIRLHDLHNAECDQFAWTYHEPRQRLGIESLKTECAIYKARGFEYLYLDRAHAYKQEIQGFEILGAMI